MIDKKSIIEAVVFLREKNQTIPSEVIEFMKQASLKAMDSQSSTGGIEREALNPDFVKVIDGIEENLNSENKRLKSLCLMIYNSDTARWWMKYEINKQFPEVVGIPPTE